MSDEGVNAKKKIGDFVLQFSPPLQAASPETLRTGEAIEAGVLDAPEGEGLDEVVDSKVVGREHARLDLLPHPLGPRCVPAVDGASQPEVAVVDHPDALVIVVVRDLDDAHDWSEDLKAGSSGGDRGAVKR